MHLKDFNYNAGEATQKARELVSALEVNDIISSSYLDNAIAVFKGNSCCEDFRLHFKIFEMDKLKSINVDIEMMLTKLDTKHTSLL